MFDGIENGGNAVPLPLNTLPAPPAVLVPPGVMGRIRAFIQRIKTHPNYTDAIGEQLQIVGTKSDDLNIETAKPSFQGASSVGKVRLDWIKANSTAWSSKVKEARKPPTVFWTRISNRRSTTCARTSSPDNPKRAATG